MGWENQRLGWGIYAQNVSNSGALGPLSTRTAKLALPLALFPNPGAAPEMRLQLLRAQTVEQLIEDLLGRPVHYSTVALPAGTHPVALPVLGVAAGTYLVRTTVDGQPLGEAVGLDSARTKKAISSSRKGIPGKYPG